MARSKKTKNKKSFYKSRSRSRFKKTKVPLRSKIKKQIKAGIEKKRPSKMLRSKIDKNVNKLKSIIEPETYWNAFPFASRLSRSLRRFKLLT